MPPSVHLVNTTQTKHTHRHKVEANSLCYNKNKKTSLHHVTYLNSTYTSFPSLFFYNVLLLLIWHLRFLSITKRFSSDFAYFSSHKQTFLLWLPHALNNHPKHKSTQRKTHQWYKRNYTWSYPKPLEKKLPLRRPLTERT